ncbi:hypothetical protein H0X09_00190 [Candidatus Saccharibacteria bacterium]|nr:hypothetical protein [Candidatus Saccharibacteria bacterium]
MVTIRNKKLRKVLLASAAIIIAGSALLYLAVARNNKAPLNDQAQLITEDGQEVNLDPPTDEEKDEANKHKEEIVNRDEQIKNPPSSSQTNPATVVITEATGVLVRAYVTGVFEEGGTCTATATQGSQVKTKSSSGFQNVSYTQCAPMEWDTPLGGGPWTIKVIYKSATAEAFQSKVIEV